MTGTTTRICFIRHGETDWNSQLRYQGQIDLELNMSGLAQAEALEAYFFKSAISAIYSSDLTRARQTAIPISRATGLPISPMLSLRERHFGRCEGLTIEEIIEQYADDAQAIESNAPDYVLPGGESRRQLNDRVLVCIEQLVRAHHGQAIAVVTHGGVLDVIYRRVRGMPIDAPRDYPIPNTGINWVAISGAEWLIEVWGSTPHLDKTA
jgi:probable phosphoglycerate mutase